MREGEEAEEGEEENKDKRKWGEGEEEEEKGISAYLCGPYMDTLIKAPWREELSVGGEGHRVDRFRVLSEGVYAGTPVNVP